MNQNDLQEKQIAGCKRELALVQEMIDNTVKMGAEVDWDKVAGMLEAIASNFRYYLANGMAASDHFISYDASMHEQTFAKGESKSL